MDRRNRLAKLLLLQRRLKELHEAKHAAFLKEAAAAEKEAADLAERLDADDSLSALFPDLYHQRIGRALVRRDQNRKRAAEEAEKIATANARANVVERVHREAVRKHERLTEEKAILDLIERRLKPGGAE